MGAGGIIVAPRAVIKTAASDPSIVGNLSPGRAAKAQAILAKGIFDWTDEEVHYLIRCIGDAYDNITP